PKITRTTLRRLISASSDSSKLWFEPLHAHIGLPFLGWSSPCRIRPSSHFDIVRIPRLWCKDRLHRRYLTRLPTTPSKHRLHFVPVQLHSSPYRRFARCTIGRLTLEQLCA